MLSKAVRELADKLQVVLLERGGRSIPTGRKPAASELSNQLWLLREPGSGSRTVVEAEMARLGITPARTLEAGSNEIIVQMAAAGLGVGLVPEAAVADAIALGRVQNVDIAEGEILRELYRLRLPRRPISQGALAFEAMIG